MSVFSLLRQSLSARRLFSTRRGWVGVDLGTRAIKLAQVERTSEGWQMAGRWLIPRGAEIPAAGSGWILEESTLAQFKRTRSMFHGSTAAVALPMSHTELRSLEIPAGSREEMRSMIREELACELDDRGGDFVCDSWETGETAPSTSGIARVTAVSVPLDASQRVFADLLSAGLECRVLDAAPCALARALEISSPAMLGKPQAALDLGHSSATFVISVAGRPVFTRVLRNCGLDGLLQPLQAGFQLSPDESQQLLARVGVSRAEHGQASVAEQAVMQLISTPLGALVGELERTLSYVAQQYIAWLPERLVLFGGGAGIRNLAQHLAAKVHLPTATWSLHGEPDGSPEPGDALFGVAVALSALAWETNQCM